MSKKKNTLQDLDNFLKQQAATLVTPNKLNEKKEEPQTVIAPVEKVEKIETPAPQEISAEKILNDLKALHKKEGAAFNKQLYDLIIKSLDSQTNSAEDKMLINTALYLKGGENWKDVIRDYWKNKVKPCAGFLT